MKYKDLKEFLEEKMRMSHIYQPLLIKALVEAGGKSTIRSLANYFASEDENQIKYYEKRIKEMPVKVLSKHKVIEKDGDLISLNVKKLTIEEKSNIKLLCEKRIQNYISSSGLKTWPGSFLDSSLVSGSDRYVVLKRANKKCELCGVSAKDSPLEVDHIIPRSLGGENTLDNYQALCQKCNIGKSNKDQTDFRDGNIKHYNKLVRDKIPEIIKKSKRTPRYKKISGKAYREALKIKLFEEVQEFNRKPSANEMADILEVLEALRIEFKISEKKVEKARSNKASKFGKFSLSYFLENVKEE